MKLVEPVIIRLGKKKIKRESCVKFLGIMLDANLSWKYHIAELSKKLSRSIGIFHKIRHLVPLEILKTLYYSLFYSFVSYGIAVWGFTHKTYVQKNFLLQKKIVRVVTFASKTDHTDPIFTNLEFLKIDGIRQLQLLSFVYDCHNKLAPVHFQEYFVPCSQVHTFNTRLASRGDLFLKRKNTFQYGIRSIEFTGARLWNMLPVPFSCRAKQTLVIIFLCLIITVLALRQCPALSALVACCLGLCLLAKLLLYFLVFSESRYLFDSILNINSILHVNCSCQIIFILLL